MSYDVSVIRPLPG